jgi:hypothetical protein
MSEIHKGKIISEDTRKRMSEAKKGKVFSEEIRKRMSEGQKGKRMSEETRNKRRDKWTNPEYRNMMLEKQRLGKIKKKFKT